nr:hypothetical protein [uncultured Nitrososphaera sp.]
MGHVQIDPSDMVKRGQFYFIYDRPPHFVMEDKTKRGLEVRERIIDEKHGVEVERGMIYDMDGIGHRVGIRWYFPKSQYSLEQVVTKAEEMEKRYKAIREMTCPDDSD